MEGIVFIIVAFALYLACDRILQAIEVRIGRRLEHRTLVFFGILLGLALVTFSTIEYLARP